MPTGQYKRPNPIDRLRTKYLISDTGCWNWIGSFSTTGYGQFSLNGKPCKAHRASYQLHIGDIPEGMLVCHHCDNPKCVNPSHLFLGSHKDNSDDKINKCRQVHPEIKGEDIGTSKLSPDQVDSVRYLKSLGASHLTIANTFKVSKGDPSEHYTKDIAAELGDWLAHKGFKE